MIQTLDIKNFTAFQQITLSCSPGVNVVIGANGTGKSHLLKLAYALSSVLNRKEPGLEQAITAKFKGVFKPEGGIGRLCRDEAQKTEIQVKFDQEDVMDFAFSADMSEVVITEQLRKWPETGRPLFLPPKEMLSSFPGFSSLYLQREITIDETYFDICQALETPKLTTLPPAVEPLIATLQQACEGEFVLMKQQRFYYKPVQGKLLEAELAAEGFRKLGMLQRLLSNGSIRPGQSGPLFWDEPEANVNPKLMKAVIAVLLALARAGQQIFLATHDYVLLKELDLQRRTDDELLFHALYRDTDSGNRDTDSGNIAASSTSEYAQVHPNAIADTFADLYDRDVERALGGSRQ